MFVCFFKSFRISISHLADLPFYLYLDWNVLHNSTLNVQQYVRTETFADEAIREFFFYLADINFRG